MEAIANNITVSNKRCLGCLRHEKDIMVTMITDEKGMFHDYFLTELQAEGLVTLLQKRLLENKDVRLND